jgi:predicted DCC family thiol-disulfide oxidoreductase YuxK/uncharacterized membrane protein YphA (DoxX/SURF4 family)
VPNDLRVASPPPKPLLVYDGDCGFCRRWVLRWKRATGDAMDFQPFQDETVAKNFPEIPREDFQAAVQLISPDGSVCAGAEAVFRALAAGGRERWLLWCHRKIPPFADLTELIYDEVAAHRDFLSKLDRFFLGADPAPPRQAWVGYLFLRGLGLVYLVAFVSLWMQIQGLIGSQGVNPAQGLMGSLKSVAASQKIGMERFHRLPTLGWWAAGDSDLNWQCGAGVGLSLLLLAGVAPAPALFLLWALYLSLSNLSSPFLNFQWDNLLLETGLLAVFLAPLQLVERPGRGPGPSRLALWLQRWLLFRLMFESGWVKLAGGDESWRHLTALRAHFETQPLPTWIGWYARQLPDPVLSVCVFLMFVIELAVPFLIFCGRKPRRVAACVFALFQAAILLTGNYTFFNWLTILLCVTLLDDEALRKLAPRRWRRPPPDADSAGGNPGARWPWKITVPVALLVVMLTALTLPLPNSVARACPRPLARLYIWLEPFRSFNGYGLFANMTQTRPEIILEGSYDGQDWRAYEFKYKPGDLKRAPAFVAPYQPRLDWQMWFAALGSVEQNPWFFRLEYSLLKNSPPVVALLARDPFPGEPPKFIRARLYDYHFTDFATRRATGQWWRRDYLGVYAPPLSLADFAPPPE